MDVELLARVAFYNEPKYGLLGEHVRQVTGESMPTLRQCQEVLEKLSAQQIQDLLYPLAPAAMLYPQPMAGDAVRLTGDWISTKAGEVGIIGGTVGLYSSQTDITFGYRCFRGPGGGKYDTGPEVVSCSGGPGTMWTDTRLLLPSDERLVVRCWRWLDYPRGNGGLDYRIEVPVWLWDGQVREFPKVEENDIQRLIKALERQGISFKFDWPAEPQDFIDWGKELQAGQRSAFVTCDGTRVFADGVMAKPLEIFWGKAQELSDETWDDTAETARIIVRTARDLGLDAYWLEGDDPVQINP